MKNTKTHIPLSIFAASLTMFSASKSEAFSASLLDSKAYVKCNNCEKYGWIPVSMKNDWKTIYGYHVNKVK